MVATLAKWALSLAVAALAIGFLLAGAARAQGCPSHERTELITAQR